MNLSSKQGIAASRRIVAVGVGTAITIAVFACRDVTKPDRAGEHAAKPSFLINPNGSVVVSPDNMHGWKFYDDQHDTTCTVATVCRMAEGPGGMPAGSGSAELSTPASGDGKALVLQDYAGTRFDQITNLQYSTYRQSIDAGNNLAIALQFNVDYDLTDAAIAYQGRLVFEPYQGAGGNVPQNTWQTWDARAGRWWGTKTSVPKNDVVGPNPCVQSSPCTWSQLLTAFPNVGVHNALGAVVLKAGSNWAGFRGNVDNLTVEVNGVSTSFNFELTGPSIIPAIAPNIIPVALFDSLGSVSSPTGHGVQWVRAMVSVTFQTTASQVDRQNAIDAIGGRVVGGFRIAEDGAYYVRIADTTFSAITAALNTVHSLPQVDYAYAVTKDTASYAAYRKPADGQGWQDWKLRPDETSSSRFNWPLEATSAPLAWGCSTGDSLTQIAIVDQGIIKSPTIAANVEFAQAFSPGPPATYFEDHGTEVAELLGAVGNDGQRSTGMMWRARLALWDMFVDQTDSSQTISGFGYAQSDFIAHYVYLAGLRGAKIINLSQALPWRSYPPLETESADTARREEAHQKLRRALERLHAANKDPLLVIAAGNDAVDAKWAGFTEVKNEFPDRVLVVGATNADGSVWVHSNKGSLVDLYGPGNGVWVFGRKATAYRDSGTSFAAPLVAGVAGLLTGFDSRLTVSQLKSFIMQGVRTSAGGIKLLDAYGALRAAAKRIGSPLCGNRVWAQGSSIVVERDTANGGTLETIATGVDGQVEQVDVRHGGTRIDYTTSSPHALVWSAGHWSATSGGATTLLAGGSWQGMNGRSHNGDTSTATRIFLGMGPIVIYPTIVDSRTPGDTTFLAMLRDDDLYLGFGRRTCISVWLSPGYPPQCILEMPDTSEHAKRQHLAYSPRGDQLFLAHNRQWTTEQGTAGTQSPDAYTVESIVKFQQVPSRSSIYAISLGDSTSAKIWDGPGTNVAWVSPSEDGTELAFAVVRDTVTWQVFPGYGSGPADDYMPPGFDWEGLTHARTIGSCQIMFIRTTAPYSATRLPVFGNDACADAKMGAGTFSPSRIPTNPSAMGWASRPLSPEARARHQPTSSAEFKAAWREAHGTATLPKKR